LSETSERVATSATYGLADTPLPRRNGSRGLLPATWTGRGVRLSYVSADGNGVDVSGKLLDACAFGPVLSVDGARCAIAWEAVRVVELNTD